MRISVIGAGHVGLTTAACLAQLGHYVLCADSDLAKLEVLREAGLPFYEPHLDLIVRNNRHTGRLQFGSSEEAVERSDVIFICVGTPPLEHGQLDLSAMECVARIIAQRARGYRLVIEKSTVPVQSGRQLQKQISLHGTSRLRYDVASNPEFLREGSAVEDFFHLCGSGDRLRRSSRGGSGLTCVMGNFVGLRPYL